MLLFTVLGPGTVRVGVMLFVLASLFGALTVLHPSFSAAGFTAGIVLLIGRLEGTPFHIGWLRVLYTLLGSFRRLRRRGVALAGARPRRSAP